MSETVECPVEGCNFVGTLEGLRGHCNGSMDDDHTWSDVKAQVTDDDQGDGDDGTSNGNQQNQQTEDEDMPTEEELERQRQQAADQDTSNEGGDKGSDTTPSVAEKTAAIPIPVTTTTLVGLAALLLVVLLVFSYIRTGGAATSKQTSNEGTKTKGETEESSGSISDDSPFVDDVSEVLE